MHDRSAALPCLAIVLAQISINLGAALGKGLFGLVGPEGVAALRTSLAALVLLAVARPWRSGIGWGHGRRLLPYGLALGAMNLLIYLAIRRIPLGIAVSIEICGPLALVLALSRAPRDFVWMAMAVAGLVLLVPWREGAGALDPVGVACALGAAACWALYIVLGKRASAIDGRSAVLIGMVAACLVTVPFGIAAAGRVLLEPRVIEAGFVVAMLSSALPYVLEMTALARLSSRVFGLVTSSAPAIAALVGVAVLGERLAPGQWLAVGLMIAASAGSTLAGRPAIAQAEEVVAV